jgi:hypothetical protein
MYAFEEVVVICNILLPPTPNQIPNARFNGECTNQTKNYRNTEKHKGDELIWKRNEIKRTLLEGWPRERSKME